MARPRDPNIDQRILDAARRVLVERGFDALTMSAVAAEAGVGKPALYRRFPTRNHLAMAATIEASEPPELPDTGSLAGDLGPTLRLLAASLELAPRALLGAQIGAAIADRDLAEEMLLPRAEAVMDTIAALWERAADRGEVDPALDGRTALQDLASAVHWHVLVYHRPADDAYLDDLLHRFLRSVAPPSPVGRPTPERRRTDPPKGAAGT